MQLPPLSENAVKGQDRPPPEAPRALWLAVRQGLLLIVRAIELQYGLRRSA